MLQRLSLLLLLLVAAVQIRHFGFFVFFLAPKFFKFVLKVHVFLLKSVDFLGLVIQFVALRVVLRHDFPNLLVFVLQVRNFKVQQLILLPKCILNWIGLEKLLAFFVTKQKLLLNQSFHFNNGLHTVFEGLTRLCIPIRLLRVQTRLR